MSSLSSDESLATEEEIALLEFIEPDSQDDEVEYIPLTEYSEEDYDWASDSSFSE
jgi:hypothetical protein